MYYGLFSKIVKIARYIFLETFTTHPLLRGFAPSCQELQEKCLLSFIMIDSLGNFQLNGKDAVLNDEFETKKLRYKFTVHKIMVSYSKLCILHFSVNISRPARVDRKQNKAA